MLHDDDDYDSYFEDTMRAGHYENRKESVDIMIRGSQDVIHDLIGYGVDFAKEDGKLLYTREGAHSKPRILFHEDITGKEITSKLLAQIKTRKQNQKQVVVARSLGLPNENRVSLYVRDGCKQLAQIWHQFM